MKNLIDSTDDKKHVPEHVEDNIDGLFDYVDNCSENPSNHNADEECNKIVMDYTSIFTNFSYFESREVLQEWVNSVAKTYNMVLVIKRSENGNGKKRAQILLACERGGEYRDNNKIGRKRSTCPKDLNDVGEKICKRKRRDTGSKKCGCPFLLKGKKLSATEWTLDVKCETHNHPLAIYLEGHPFAGRLTREELEIVINMSKYNTPAKDVLQMLKERNPYNCSTIRTIYNARSRHNLNDRNGRNQLQHLMKLLIDNNYFHHERTCPNTNTLLELFFAHPTGIQLFRAFPGILLMDCTYKTNRYKLPYLEMVGITSTGMTFSVASTFLNAEKEENYIWALSVLRDVLNDVDLPKIIITDRELSLMNAVTYVFPEATQFLCSWHIDRNVMAKCKEKFDTDEKWKKFFYGSWKSVMDSSTEEEFANVLQSFHNDYADVPIECEAYHYCMNQWIYPYKVKFVAAWTNKVMHYENRTTNRVESHHSALKKSLGNSMGNFESCWKRVDTLYQASHNAVKASFEKSGNVIMHKLRGVIFKDLIGLVSEYALEKNYAELQGIPKGKLDPQICDHFLRNVCGLPCTHELHEYKRLGTSIPLEVVDKFWRKLDMKPTLNSENNIKDDIVGDIDSRFEEKIEELKRQYEKGELSKKRVILRQLNELNHPSTTSMVEPAPKTTTRGRPKASLSKKKEYASTKRDPSFFEYKQSVPFRGPVLSNKTVILDVPDKCSATQKPKKKLQVSRKRDFTDLLPMPFRPFILECRDVVPDGHCGFRAVAALMGIGEENWAEVRRGMMNELSRNIKLYMRVFKEELMVDEISNALNCFTTPAPLANWFQLPYMGYLVASLYNVVVIVLSRMSLTFLPLRTAPPETPKSICIGLVNNNHFIQVFLKPDRQLPPVADSWHQTKLITAEGWLEAYVNNRIR